MTKLIVALRDFENVHKNSNAQHLGQQINIICFECKTYEFSPAVKLTTKLQTEAASQDTVLTTPCVI
jgi:hypothetical protein